MESYLDNSATTVCSKRATDMVVRLLTEDYGNPSAMHQKGVIAENYIKDAKQKIASTLKVDEKEIYFTSGGTESNNMALIGASLANKRAGMHIITTGIEHASIYATTEFLKEQGFEITYLPVDKDGLVDLDALSDALREDTILVSVMQVNNEIGAVEPIDEIAKIVHKKSKNAIFHVDAIQSYGKMIIRPRKSGIDMLSVSGHKIHGPKGSGFLYIRDKVKMKPLILGGGQQKGMRSGTENVPAYCGLAEAATEMYENFEENIEHLWNLKNRFIEGVQKIDGCSVNGKTDMTSAPHIVSVSVDGVRSEVLLHSLESENVYVSAGSACSSNKPAVSRTLKAINLNPKLLDSTIRFSFSVHTTEEEIDYALSVMGEVVPKLRKYVRR
ncbi:MAG: cysteine desulfurase [Lachnospiraceae bacterium]|nr:cysteine desulfurase [Lachnospiraceae bacterium]